MDVSSISGIKAAIRAEYEARITKLRHEMDTVLASLSAAEETFGVVPALAARSTRTLPISYTAQTEAKAPSAKNRILAQKQTTHGRFYRMQLFDSVINDGYGAIPIGTFSLPFSILTKQGEIVLVEKGSGNTPSVYMWKDEFVKEAFSAGPTLELGNL